MDPLLSSPLDSRCSTRTSSLTDTTSSSLVEAASINSNQSRVLFSISSLATTSCMPTLSSRSKARLFDTARVVRHGSSLTAAVELVDTVVVASVSLWLGSGNDDDDDGVRFVR